MGACLVISDGATIEPRSRAVARLTSVVMLACAPYRIARVVARNRALARDIVTWRNGTLQYPSVMAKPSKAV
jgi:hypothetical protein